MTKKECENCTNYRTDYDLHKGRFVKTCRAYPNLMVYGFVSGLINKDCMEFHPIRTEEHKSLAQKTFEMAGGKYDRKTEQERSGIKDITPWRPLKWYRPCR